MAHGVNNKTGSSFLVVALAAILVLGGVTAACSRATTTTTTQATTTRITTSQATTTMSAPAASTTMAANPTTTAGTSTGQSAADYYKANVVTVIVPYAAGGGVDFAARLFASYWPEITGGRMIVDNKTGAGGLLAANYVYAAKPDGLTLGVGISGTGLIAPVLAQDPAVKFDLKKLNWIEFTNPETYSISISAKLPQTSMGDFSKLKGLKFGSSTPFSTNSLGAALLIDFYGLQDARIVLGYAGSSDVLLAAAKGEVDAYVTNPSVLLDGAAKGLVKRPFLALSFDRNSYIPDVPTIPEQLKLSTEQENLLRTFNAFIDGQLFWFQPGVPQDRIEFVRGAFDKIVANENFVKQAKTRWPIWVTPTGGKEYAAQIEKILTVATPERYTELQKLTNKYVR